MQLENIESLVIIICTIIGTGITTIFALFSLQKSFRNHLDNLFEDYDRTLKAWITQALEDYYLPLDDRIKNLNYRLKEVEKR